MYLPWQYFTQVILKLIDPNFLKIEWRTLNFSHGLQTNILVRLLSAIVKNVLTPKIRMCDPILLSLLKMRLHFCQSSRENATPSSGTSPLASYKEVAPAPGIL